MKAALFLIAMLGLTQPSHSSDANRAVEEVRLYFQDEVAPAPAPGWRWCPTTRRYILIGRFHRECPAVPCNLHTERYCPATNSCYPIETFEWECPRRRCARPIEVYCPRIDRCVRRDHYEARCFEYGMSPDEAVWTTHERMFR